MTLVRDAFRADCYAAVLRLSGGMGSVLSPFGLLLGEPFLALILHILLFPTEF
jgi:hypothetical protein